MPDHVDLPITIDIRRPAFTGWPNRSRAATRAYCARNSRRCAVASRPLWTSSYLVATVGGATLEVVKRNVDNQRNVQDTGTP
jgi:REP-associated tyrosine transposase